MDIFDKATSLEKAGGDPDLAKELFQMLISSLPTLKENLNEEYARHPNGACLEVAHKIYGSTAYCGVPQLRETARSLEDVIKSGSENSIIESQLQLVNDAIDNLLRTAPDIMDNHW